MAHISTSTVSHKGISNFSRTTKEPDCGEDVFFPKTLMIEPTNICTFKCPACPTGLNLCTDKSRGAMEFGRFKIIIDQVDGFIERIDLFNYGEPFLAPDIMKMILYANNKNIFLNIHTNGEAIKTGQIDEFKKIKSELSLSFSIDGITPESFSHYRIGGDIKKVLKNLKAIISIKKRCQLPIKIIWQFLIHRKNEREIPEAIELARKIGLDSIRFKTLSIKKTNPRYNDFIPQSSAFSRRQIVGRQRICRFVDPGMPTIMWNGDVVACCKDYKRDRVFGNAFREKMVDIWNSKQYKHFRNNFKSGKNKYCENKCPVNYRNKIFFKEYNFTTR